MSEVILTESLPNQVEKWDRLPAGRFCHDIIRPLTTSRSDDLVPNSLGFFEHLTN